MSDKSLRISDLGPEQQFFRDDHYGPDQDKTSFESNKNDQGEYGVFSVIVRDGKLDFMRVRIPGWLFVGNIKSGAYKPVEREEVEKSVIKVKTAFNKENLPDLFSPMNKILTRKGMIEIAHKLKDISRDVFEHSDPV